MNCKHARRKKRIIIWGQVKVLPELFTESLRVNHLESLGRIQWFFRASIPYFGISMFWARRSFPQLSDNFFCGTVKFRVFEHPTFLLTDIIYFIIKFADDNRKIDWEAAEEEGGEWKKLRMKSRWRNGKRKLGSWWKPLLNWPTQSANALISLFHWQHPVILLMPRQYPCLTLASFIFVPFWNVD